MINYVDPKKLVVILNETYILLTDENDFTQFWYTIQNLEAQKSLLGKGVKQIYLLESKSLSSIQPKVGKKIDHIKIEERKNKILMETRKNWLSQQSNIEKSKSQDV